MYFCECEGDVGDGMCDITKQGTKYFKGCELYDDGSLPQKNAAPQEANQEDNGEDNREEDNN